MENVLSHEDLFDDDDVKTPEVTETEETEEAPVGIENPINAFLELYGINDGKLTYENEDGTEEEVEFSQLTPEEQFEVLKNLTAVEEKEDDEETKFLKTLRSKGQTLEDFIQSEIAKASIVPTSKLTDDEVYLQALKSQFEDMTDEELVDELETAKARPNFAKKVTAYRQQLIEVEEAQQRLAQEEENKKYLMEIEEQKKSVVAAARGINEIAGFKFDDATKNQLLGQLIELTEDGNSPFVNALSNPENMVKAAWYMYYGDSAFNSLHEYYSKELTKAYNKGKKEGIEGLSTAPVNKGASAAKKVASPTTKSVEDLYN